MDIGYTVAGHRNKCFLFLFSLACSLSLLVCGQCTLFQELMPISFSEFGVIFYNNQQPTVNLTQALHTPALPM